MRVSLRPTLICSSTTGEVYLKKFALFLEIQGKEIIIFVDKLVCFMFN